MPTITNTQPVLGPDPLSANLPFTGLMVLSPGPGMPGYGCCNQGQCLIIPVESGTMGDAFIYSNNSPTVGLNTLPAVDIPPTDENHYYHLGFMAGVVEDLLSNMPVSSPCSRCKSLELTIPDQASLELSDLLANSAPYGTTPAVISGLEAEVSDLTDQLETATNTIEATQAALDSTTDNLSQCEADLSAAQLDLVTLASDLEASAGDNQDLQDQVSDLSSQVTDLQQQITDLTTQQSDAEAEAEALAISEIQAKIASLKIKICQAAVDVPNSSTTNTTTATVTDDGTINGDNGGQGDSQNTTGLGQISGGGSNVVSIFRKLSVRPGLRLVDCDRSNATGSDEPVAFEPTGTVCPEPGVTGCDGDETILSLANRVKLGAKASGVPSCDEEETPPEFPCPGSDHDDFP